MVKHGHGWVSSGRVTYDVGGFRVGRGYVVEVEGVDKGRCTASAVQGRVHETRV